MTVLKFLMSTGVCTTGELIAFKKADATGDDYRKLREMAIEQMKARGIPIEESDAVN